MRPIDPEGGLSQEVKLPQEGNLNCKEVLRGYTAEQIDVTSGQIAACVLNCAMANLTSRGQDVGSLLPFNQQTLFLEAAKTPISEYIRQEFANPNQILGTGMVLPLVSGGGVESAGILKETIENLKLNRLQECLLPSYSITLRFGSEVIQGVDTPIFYLTEHRGQVSRELDKLSFGV